MIEGKSTPLTKAVTTAYRRGWLPARGYGKLFSSTPARLWGGPDVRTQTEVGEFVLRLADPGAQFLLTFGTLADEERETAFMRRFLPQARVFVDVGANYGWYSRMASGARRDGVVVAVEASPMLLPYLRKNAGPNARVVHAMVTDRAGDGVFHLAENSTMSSPTRAIGTEVDVPATTVDAICAELGEAPDLIKCDVEGGELAVLRGAEQVRSGALPPVWLIEVYEQYLLENGETYEALDREFQRFGPVSYFLPAENGDLVPLPTLEDLRSRDSFNVVAVPLARLESVAPFLGAAVATPAQD